MTHMGTPSDEHERRDGLGDARIQGLCRPSIANRLDGHAAHGSQSSSQSLAHVGVGGRARSSWRMGHGPAPHAEERPAHSFATRSERRGRMLRRFVDGGSGQVGCALCLGFGPPTSALVVLEGFDVLGELQ